MKVQLTCKEAHKRTFGKTNRQQIQCPCYIQDIQKRSNIEGKKILNAGLKQEMFYELSGSVSKHVKTSLICRAY